MARDGTAFLTALGFSQVGPARFLDRHAAQTTADPPPTPTPDGDTKLAVDQPNVLFASYGNPQIADSGVNSPWYLLFALFWAVLWRSGTRAGMAGPAAVGFLTAASTTMSVVFAPLLLARVIALPGCASTR
jgi:hypothetical protein